MDQHDEDIEGRQRRLWRHAEGELRWRDRCDIEGCISRTIGWRAIDWRERGQTHGPR
jgi:hypothetical protein